VIDDILSGSVGTPLAELGGEPGALARAVEAATRHGAAGQLPFAALVAQGGTVVGAGANTALADLDPAGHGEVVALRDATRRAGRLDLSGAVVYSSCEPCAICRTVAAAVGVTEIVYAAGKELVPAGFDPDPRLTAALIDAVTALLPGIARRGRTTLGPVELAAPFRAFAQARAGTAQ
jgi:tRNA(Arg) A34 adenosine deaminase TadA